MKNTFSSGLRFVGVGAVLFAALYLASEWLDPVYPEMRARRNLLRAHGGGIEAVSFGNSQARAIAFDALALRGVHLWRPAGDLHEVSFLIRELLPDLPAVRCVLVVLSPYALVSDNAAPTPRDRRDRRREMYARTASLRHLEGDWREMVGGKLAPVARADNWGPILRGRRRQLPVTAEGLVLRADSNAVLTPDSLVRHARWRAAQHRESAAEILAVRPDAPDRGAGRLEEVVRAATAHGVDVLLFTPPYTREYLDALEPEALAAVRAAGAAVAAANPGVEYLDASTLAGFGRTPAYFRDGDHLNHAGARAFSAHLRDWLAEANGGRGHCLPGGRVAPSP